MQTVSFGLRTDLGVVEGDELVTQSTDLTVHDKTLKITLIC